MATTYTLISSTTLTGSQATVTFSSIPSTYTDLVLRVSGRTNVAQISGYINVRFNSDTATNYSYTTLSSYSGGYSSNGSSVTSLIVSDAANGSSATSNTFSNVEIYVPNYTSNTSKQIGTRQAAENNTSNTTDARVGINADLYRGSSAIATITITPDSGSFVTDSSFYLYGIKNS